MKICGRLQVAVALLLSTIAIDAHADEIILKDGGRLRGTISEHVPGDRATIVLADGTVRTVVASEISSVVLSTAQPEQGRSEPTLEGKSGALTVTTDAAGEVFVREQGRRRPWRSIGRVSPQAPFSTRVGEGPLRVRVDFDDGGADAENVVVHAERPGSFAADSPHWDRLRFSVGPVGPTFNALRFLSGGYWAFGAAGGVAGRIHVPTEGFSEVFAGLSLLTGRYSSSAQEVGVRLTASGGYRFGIGSVYGLEAGVELGLFHFYQPFAVVGARASALSLRVGPRRNVAILLDHGVQIMPGEGGTLLNVDSAIGMHFLFP